jgi:hypothetical protein
VAIIMQLNDRSISGFIAFLVGSVRTRYFDWNALHQNDEVEYHLEPLDVAGYAPSLHHQQTCRRVCRRLLPNSSHNARLVREAR